MAYDPSTDLLSSAYGYNAYDQHNKSSNVFNDWLHPKQAEYRDYLSQLSLQHDAQSFNAMEAQKQRDWEAMMSNSAVQRNVADIKAAGLNPWLAVQGSGSIGASTPTGASASSAGGHSSHNNYNGVSQVLSSALNVVSKALDKFKTTNRKK